ncbi:MAG: mannose-1-phosphate guanylyltransferase/mannose-6-phosphate isomerase [Desulfocapsaceae bacterium]|nr:mannose-1-phosphate guanylyltransferase/mannose-6-phosphate isomerase [Desulfosporosinus sp.]MDR3629557.1 mannose-1-phosphate guanylyltransferase/mannose-6-phosphate isomerase [Desulfocapsaceae bacterium]
MQKIQPVILAGGTGSRLWPLSRELYPKQLLQLTDATSLLQTTVLRVAQVPDMLPPIIVVGEEHRFITKSQIEELSTVKDYTILLEPMGRNTAPAVAGAVEYVAAGGDQDVIILVLPADHLVKNLQKFREVVKKAAGLAAEGLVVTFGIEPRHAETGYGYIERGEGNRVLSFKEKPDLSTAKEYLEKGNYFWNSGMFAFSVKTFREEMATYAPEILARMTEAAAGGGRDQRFFRFDSEAMSQCPSDSLDYALMEKTAKAAVVAADLGWSDIGSWQALWEVSEKNTDGNILLGRLDNLIVKDTKNSLIRSDDRLVATVGLEETLVVETADAVLVAPLSRSQDVKKIVEDLKKQGRKEFRFHRTVYRPWGSYTVLEEQPRYQMKRITVNPGQKLSLQMHHHRYEHWVVVTGTARVTNGDDVSLIYENQSVYIKAGALHRLENPGVIPLELIEVQIGSYLGEDDIVRFDDDYGRDKD